MNRFLVFASGSALMIAVMSAAFMLFGYSTGDLLTVVLAVPTFSAVIMMALIFVFAVGADLLISLLVFSMKTWGKKSDRLRLATRWFIVKAGDPPDLFVLTLLVSASAAAIYLTAAILPRALTSPSFAADIAMSVIFWVLFNALGVLAESNE